MTAHKNACPLWFLGTDNKGRRLNMLAAMHI